eukprot:s664_g25.t1
MSLLPQLPDAMVGIVSALSLTENFAVRASCRGVETSISEGFLRLQRLEIQRPVVHSLATPPPKCLGGLQHLILKQGISLVKNGQLPDLAEELAAAAHFAVQLPRLGRVDLSRYDCSLLFNQKAGDREVPVLPHCFRSTQGEDLDRTGFSLTKKTFEICLKEATLWSQFLKAAEGSRCGDAVKGEDWPISVTRVRHSACAVAGSARRFVAHSLCSAQGTDDLISDLKLLTNLADLHVVWWPETPGSTSSREPSWAKRVVQAFPTLRRFDETFTQGAQPPVVRPALAAPPAARAAPAARRVAPPTVRPGRRSDLPRLPGLGRPEATSIQKQINEMQFLWQRRVHEYPCHIWYPEKGSSKIKEMAWLGNPTVAQGAAWQVDRFVYDRILGPDIIKESTAGMAVMDAVCCATKLALGVVYLSCVA